MSLLFDIQFVIQRFFLVRFHRFKTFTSSLHLCNMDYIISSHLRAQTFASHQIYVSGKQLHITISFIINFQFDFQITKGKYIKNNDFISSFVQL
jgi:hypothetical protein